MARLGYIDLDCVVKDTETIEDVMNRLETENDINVFELTDKGPNGWPVIRIIGEKVEVAEVVLHYWEDPDLIDQIDDIKRMR